MVVASVVVALVVPFVVASWVASLVAYLVGAFAAVGNTYYVEFYKNHTIFKHILQMKFNFSKWRMTWNVLDRRRSSTTTASIFKYDHDTNL